jgi:hypothetical protein
MLEEHFPGCPKVKQEKFEGWDFNAVCSRGWQGLPCLPGLNSQGIWGKGFSSDTCVKQDWA